MKLSGASVGRPVLLLLDGDKAHTRNRDVVNEVRATYRCCFHETIENLL